MNDQDEPGFNPYRESIQYTHRGLLTTNRKLDSAEYQGSPADSPIKFLPQHGDEAANMASMPGQRPVPQDIPSIFQVDSVFQVDPVLNRDLIQLSESDRQEGRANELDYPNAGQEGKQAADDGEEENQGDASEEEGKKSKCPRLVEFWDSKGWHYEAPVYCIILLLVPFLLIRLLYLASQMYRIYPTQIEQLPNFATNWNKDSIFRLSNTAYPDLPEPQENFYVELVTGIWPANTDGCLCSDIHHSDCFTKPRACKLHERNENRVQVSNRGEQIIHKWKDNQIWVIRGRKTSMFDHFTGYLNSSQCKIGYKACPSDKLGDVFCISSSFRDCPITSISNSTGSYPKTDTGIKGPGQEPIFTDDTSKKSPLVELLYSFGTPCIDRDQGTYVGDQHFISKYQLFLNGKYSKRNFSCMEDRTGSMISKSSAEQFLISSKILTHHLHRLNFDSSAEISLWGFNVHPWDRSCGSNSEALLLLPSQMNAHAKDRQNAFYWMVMYICSSFLCWALTRLPIRLTRSQLSDSTINAFKKNNEFMKKMQMGVDRDDHKETREKVLDVLESHKLKQLGAIGLNILICVADLTVLVFAYKQLEVLIDQSTAQGRKLLPFISCAPGLAHLLQAESAKLMQPESLKKSFTTFLWVPFCLRLLVLFWTTSTLCCTHKNFEVVLEDVKKINPRDSLIEMICTILQNIFTGDQSTNVKKEIQKYDGLPQIAGKKESQKGPQILAGQITGITGITGIQTPADYSPTDSPLLKKNRQQLGFELAPTKTEMQGNGTTEERSLSDIQVRERPKHGSPEQPVKEFRNPLEVEPSRYSHEVPDMDVPEEEHHRLQASRAEHEPPG